MPSKIARNILIINHYAGSKNHGMEYRPYYLAREWVKSGHKVTIVAASVSHVRSEQPIVKGGATEEEIDGIRYLWLKTPGYHGNGPGRFINMLTFIWRLYNLKRKLAVEFRPDVVIASSTYPLDIYPAHSIAKMVGAKLIFEVHDLWPLSPMELGGMSPRHPFIMIMQRAEDYAYRVADIVVSMLPKADAHMREHGMAPHKFVYVPNGIAVDEWETDRAPLPELHSETLRQKRQEGRFIVGYAGAHGLANALDTLIDAAYLLRDQPVSIVLVGQGPEKEALQHKIASLGLTNVILLPPVPKSAIPELMASMGALYIGLQKQPLFRFGVSPNKLMDYMMAAKPVIYAIEAGNNMVAESGCGTSVPPEDANAIADAVTGLMRMTSDERYDTGARGRKYILEHHDYEVLAKRFLDIME